MLLFACAAAHFCTDAVCAAVIFGPLHALPELSLLVILYNTLAFSTQPFAGLLADRFPGMQPYFGSGAMGLVLLGWVLPVPAALRILLVGVGNSILHVACGTLVLIKSGGKAAKLGVFVAPGAVGLAMGTLFPEYGWFYAAGLLAAAALLIPLAKREAPFAIEAASEPEKPLLPVILLTFAVAVRAIGGGAVSFPWKSGALMALLLAGFVFFGKFAGGFLCDRIGPKYAALLSILLATPLVLFASRWAAPSLIGQLALNLTMPVTLWLLYLEMPRSPGFSFGLAASALWPGTVAGGLLKLEGLPQQICVGLCFLFALLAIFVAIRHLNRNRKESFR